MLVVRNVCSASPKHQMGHLPKSSSIIFLLYPCSKAGTGNNIVLPANKNKLHILVPHHHIITFSHFLHLHICTFPHYHIITSSNCHIISLSNYHIIKLSSQKINHRFSNPCIPVNSLMSQAFCKQEFYMGVRIGLYPERIF